MENVKRKIIGISGKAGAGKDTAAARLIAEHGFVRIAFADALKAGAQAMFGFDYEQINGSKKEIVDERYGKSPRQIMQLLGTEFGRKLVCDDVWLRVMRARLDAWAHVHVVIPDVRFPNELEAVQAWGGQVWRVERPGVAAVNPHPSETALDDAKFDRRLVNNQTIEVLNNDVDRLIVSR